MSNKSVHKSIHSVYKGTKRSQQGEGDTKNNAHPLNKV